MDNQTLKVDLRAKSTVVKMQKVHPKAPSLALAQKTQKASGRVTMMVVAMASALLAWV